MPAEDDLRLDEGLMTRYLLGTLPENETERLDSLSVTDDDFALRLLAVENDLVDSYARGELSGETRRQFEAFYTSSAVRRQKVAFAQTILGLAPLAKNPPVRVSDSPVVPAASGTTGTPRAPGRRSFWSASNLRLQWALAGAALALLLVVGYLRLQNRSLQNELESRRSGSGAGTEEQLKSQLAEQRHATAAAQEELAQLRRTLTHADGRSVTAILLLPQTRGASQRITLAVDSGTDKLPLRLQLESDGYQNYRVALKDLAAGKTVWTSGLESAESGSKYKTISIEVPARELRERNYILELSGVSAGGSAELLSTYVFRVTIR